MYVYTEHVDNSNLRSTTTRKDKSISSYFSDGVTQKFKTGQTIIQGFEEPSGVYLIKEGFVKAFSTSHTGHANLLFIHGSGEFIPLPWALDGIHTTGLSYEAMTNVMTIKSPKDKLHTAMGNNMWLTREILNQTVNIVAVYTQRIQTLEFRTARGRVIAELLFFAERFGKLHDNQIIIEAPITHQDIADSVNINRETASRAIELLMDEGLVRQDDHLFIIRDIAELRDALK